MCSRENPYESGLFLLNYHIPKKLPFVTNKNKI